MNRPRIVGVLSTVLGSTAGFLVLSLWHLAGTVTGAILMPVIFTFVSFCSHEGMERFSKWFGCRLKKDLATLPPEEPATADTPTAGQVGPGRRSVQWAVVTMAFLAFGFSLYSLTQEPAAGITILQDKVIERVTVTTERPAYSVAHDSATESTTVTTAGATAMDDQTTTTTLVQDGQEDPTVTTVSTVPETGTTTPTVP